MRNLIRFILKHQNFFLFFLLEGFAFLFLINHNAYQSASFFNLSSGVSGGLQSQVSNISEYFDLKRENELLQAENARLKAVLSNIAQADTFPIPVQPDSLNDYSFIPAKVVNISVSNRSNYAIINAGEKDSIKAGMGVISNKGVVGVIKATSQHFSVVMPIINHNYRVSSKFANSNYFGSLSWDGLHHQTAQLNAIEKHVPIHINDSIVTTGFSATFPEGIPVGTVSHFTSDPDEDFYNIEINLATNFKTVSSVYVISMKHKDERLQLSEEETND